MGGVNNNSNSNNDDDDVNNYYAVVILMPNAQRHCGRKRKKWKRKPKPNLAQTLQYLSHSLHSQTWWDLKPSGWRSKRQMRGSKNQKDSEMLKLHSSQTTFYFILRSILPTILRHQSCKELQLNQIYTTTTLDSAPRLVHVRTTFIGLCDKPEAARGKRKKGGGDHKLESWDVTAWLGIFSEISRSRTWEQKIWSERRITGVGGICG